MARTGAAGEFTAVATWDAVDIDLTSVDADQAPVEIPGLSGMDYVRLLISGVTTGKSYGFQLIEVDSGGRIRRAIEIATTATARRTAHAGDAGEFLHDDVVVDIRGHRGGSKWYLALVDIDTDTGVTLIAYDTFKHPS